jgi:photosystem II stability/assembly factor-like uncharacterized protein
LRVLEFLDNAQGWTASDDGDLYKTLDGGTTWARINLDNPARAQVVGVSFVSSTVGWVVLQRRANRVLDYESNQFWLLHTTDGGLTWLQQHKDNADITQLAFANQNEGWLVGMKWSRKEQFGQSYFVLHTIDRGQHWDDLSEKLNELVVGKDDLVQDLFTDLHTASPGEATLLSQHGRIFRTTDSGVKWQQIAAIENEPPQTCICDIGVTADMGIWVAGGAYSIEGTWGMFSRAKTDELVTYTLPGIYFSDLIRLSDTEMFASGLIPVEKNAALVHGRTEGVVLYSLDGGYHWAIVYRDATIKAINALASLDADHISAVGDRGLVLRLERRLGK